MFVFPVAPIVRDPVSRKALPPEGREVPESTYWVRRLASGDVSLKDPRPVINSEPSPESEGYDPGGFGPR